MAVTKILAKRARLDVMINYATNGDKTQEGILTSYYNCTPENAYCRMMETKREAGKTDGVQGYHIIQSFKAGELSPEQAHELALQYVRECVPGFEAVIGTHIDKEHIHNHIVFNSVNTVTGEKYRSNAKSYFTQIRAISDKLCREHGLSVIITGEQSKSVSYSEWLREQRGQPTYRSMLEADMRRAIDDANDVGHFLILMENMGYEAKHGSRLSFRLRGQEKWIVPGRRDPLFTEGGIRAAIAGNLEAIEAGLKPAFTPRRVFEPYVKRPKYTGFLALYVHYLYLLGKIQKQEYPPKMTAHLKAEVMKFDKYKAQFAFIQTHDIYTPEQLSEYRQRAEERITILSKQRTIQNVQKKKRKPLYDALADAEAYAPAKALYDDGITGIEDEFVRYMDAIAVLEKCGVSRDQLSKEKSEMYEKIAAINSDMRAARKDIALCDEIIGSVPKMEKDIRSTEKTKDKEVKRNDRRR